MYLRGESQMLGKYVYLSFLRFWKIQNFVTNISSPSLMFSSYNQHHANRVQTHTLLVPWRVFIKQGYLGDWGPYKPKNIKVILSLLRSVCKHSILMTLCIFLGKGARKYLGDYQQWSFLIKKRPWYQSLVSGTNLSSIKLIQTC